MPFLARLPRSWVSIPLPGTVQPNPFRTYVSYSFEALPPAPPDVAAMAWLEKAPAHPEDYLATRFADAAQRDLSWSDVAELWPDPEALPDDFVHFLGHRGPGLRDRLRSATDCYFDLGDSLVEVEGGRLLHLISDSQWVFHWLLYVGDDAASAVVGTQSPAGFDLEQDGRAAWRGVPVVRCRRELVRGVRVAVVDGQRDLLQGRGRPCSVVPGRGAVRPAVRTAGPDLRNALLCRCPVLAHSR